MPAGGADGHFPRGLVYISGHFYSCRAELSGRLRLKAGGRVDRVRKRAGKMNGFKLAAVNGGLSAMPQRKKSWKNEHIHLPMRNKPCVELPYWAVQVPSG